MSNIWKGESIGPRLINKPSLVEKLCKTSVVDLKGVIIHASKVDLIEAHRWCERSPYPHKKRRDLLAAGIRKRILAEQTEENMRRATRRPITRKAGRR